MTRSCLARVNGILEMSNVSVAWGILGGGACIVCLPRVHRFPGLLGLFVGDRIRLARQPARHGYLDAMAGGAIDTIGTALISAPVGALAGALALLAVRRYHKKPVRRQ